MARWRAEVAYRAAEEAEAKRVQIHSTIDFLDLPSSAMWDQEEAHEGCDGYPYEYPVEGEMERMNEMLCDAVGYDEDTGAMAVNMFWDYGIDISLQTQNLAPTLQRPLLVMGAAEMLPTTTTPCAEGIERMRGDEKQEKRVKRSSKALLNTSRFKESSTGGSAEGRAEVQSGEIVSSKPTPAKYSSMYSMAKELSPSYPITTGEATTSARNTGNAYPGSTFANYPYTMGSWYHRRDAQAQAPSATTGIATMQQQQQAMHAPRIFTLYVEEGASRHHKEAVIAIPDGFLLASTMPPVHPIATPLPQQIQLAHSHHSSTSNSSSDDATGKTSSASMYSTSHRSAHSSMDLAHTLWAVHSMYN
jgi:hypothetical protein